MHERRTLATSHLRAFEFNDVYDVIPEMSYYRLNIPSSLILHLRKFPDILSLAFVRTHCFDSDPLTAHHSEINTASQLWPD